MQVIDASLLVAGDDKIKDLYKFIEKRQAVAKESENFSDWLMYTRIMVELSLAIATYACFRDKE